MSEHYIILADRGHLKFYQERNDPEQMTPGLTLEQALEFPSGFRNYTDDEADAAGRFQSSKQQAGGAGAPTARTGMSIDERLPLAREVDRKQVRDLAQAIESFLQEHPRGTWDFAAPPDSHNAVLESLSASVKARLGKSLPKNLVGQPVDALRGHFLG